MFESPGPLSVGNVVSAALRLYRDRFQSYFGIAFGACSSIPLMIWAVTTSFNFDPSNLTSFGLVLGVSFLIFILLNVMAIPFWQGIKSVIYYDLRSRREGFGLDLADSPGDSW